MRVNGIELDEARETMLITLYEKAQDYEAKYSILHDKMAYETAKKLNADLTKYESLTSITPVRAKEIDDWTKEFLAKHVDGCIIYLGAGMDTRYWRIAPASTVEWYEVDFPEVMALKEVLLPTSSTYHLISSSILEKEWLAQIPNEKPVLIIAEGVLEYLEASEVKELFGRLIEHFGHGELIFDVMNSFAVDSGKENLKDLTQAVHKWKVDDLEVIDDMHPQLRRVKELSVYHASGMKNLPLKTRLMYKVLTKNKMFRNMIRLLKYEF